jgi:ABC-2 type transport system ATP-binding protein
MAEKESDRLPMIEVRNLTKFYGDRSAIQDLSFTVSQGEIVGFIGPNGAGKSTTMRILAGFLSATQGTARVAGHDVSSESEEVRQRVGFMPENNPLHDDMRVREYLKFRARLKGLNRQESRDRVEDVMEQMALVEVQRQMISELSKGYRQRVGLADALVHDPELLILDEPTIGLDPHQIRTVRQHIKELGREHTVLISSHILPEVEVTCTQLLIFHEGKILAADTPRGLEKQLGGRHRITVELNAPIEELGKAWEEMAEIEHHRILPAEGEFHQCALTPRDGEDLRPRISALAHARNWPLRELTRERHTLEDIFVQITRDEEDY